LPLPERHLTALVEQVANAARVVQQVVNALRERSHHERALELCIRINEIENHADGVLREALAELFDKTHDPIQLIKWKEVWELLEEATDRCEDVADTVENLLLEA
jgi:uncharacterized protein Yka (UPF0111/DUF47 family)